MSAAEIRFRPEPLTLRLLGGLAAAGGLVFLAGLLVDPRRAWTGFLVGFNLIAGLGLSGALFVALLVVSGGRWATAMRRVPEAMSRCLPWAFALGLVLPFGAHSLYEWSHPAVVAADPLLREKAAYLDLPFFTARLVLYFALWIALARALVAPSVRQDSTGESLGTPRGLVRAALFVAVFGVTYSLASVDWIQSLEPHWYSTIFALRTATGLACAGLSAATVLVVVLRARGPLRGVVTDDHLHDLAKLLFGFSILWGYIRYCQYMLIWYSNIPEETVHYLARGASSWRALSYASVALMWGVPFAVLLFRSARRSGAVLSRVAIAVLLGWAFDLYGMIGPAIAGEEARPGLFEVGAVAGAVALFFLATLRALSRVPLVPLRDPTLGSSPPHAA